MTKKTAAGRPAKKARPAAAAKGSRVTGPAGGGAPWKESRLAMVQRLIASWSEKLEEDVTKSGVAELIRLLTLEKELSETRETVKEIKVTWVEPDTAESSKSE